MPQPDHDPGTPAPPPGPEKQPATPPGPPPPPPRKQEDPGSLSPEEQLRRYEESLKNDDWGHQPC